MASRNKMKIMFLSDEFPLASSGGAGIIAYQLAKGMQKSGHELHIITPVRKRSLEGVSNFKDLKIYRIYSNYHPRWQAYLSLYNPQIVSKVKKIVKQVKPDIVHAHNIHYYLSYHCLKIARKYAKGVFLTAHDTMLVNYGKLMPKDGKDIYKVSIWDQLKEARKRYNPLRNIVIRHYLKYVDRIFAVSNTLGQFLKFNGIRNVVIIYNGIDIDDWKISKEEVNKFKIKYSLQDKKIILFGGRLSEGKGGEVALRAMKLVKQRIDNVILLVVGEKNWYSQKMIKLTKELDIKDNVKFLGWLKRKEMKLVISASDVCLTPSIYLDPFNLFNIEAGAAKKAVVGTCFGGTSEIVLDNKTGYILNPNNIQLMAKKIIDLLKNPEKAEKFGRTGYERVKKHFSFSKQVKETLKWYKKYL